jgi:hypothetical protein
MFVNLSNHSIDILSSDTQTTTFGSKDREKLALVGEASSVTFPKYEGSVPKVVYQSGVVKVINKIAVHYPGGKVVHNLPKPPEGVIYISSKQVVDAAKELGRTDVVCPGPLVFAEPFEEGGRGTVVGCLGLMG